MTTHVAVEHAALGAELYWAFRRSADLAGHLRAEYGSGHRVVEAADAVTQALLTLRKSLADVSGEVDGHGHYFPVEEVMP